jgi:hypothetical protein
MVAEIKRRGYGELEGMFGLGMEKEMEITKISLIAYGSREQMLHRDMTMDRTRDLLRGTVAPGSMIFNLQGGSCRLGVVYIGDTEDEDDIGKGKGFRHFGGVSFRVENIGKGCFAWLDAGWTQKQFTTALSTVQKKALASGFMSNSRSVVGWQQSWL